MLLLISSETTDLGLGVLAGLELSRVASVSQAAERLAAGLLVQMIVVQERWPGEFPATDFARLQQVSPLTPIWRIAGPWCEGEMRTSPPPAGTLRSYAHQTLPRLATELELLTAGRAGDSAQPATMTEEQRMLARSPTTGHVQTASRFVVVYAVERDAGLALLDLCRCCGWSGIWTNRLNGVSATGVDIAICDLRPHQLGDPQLAAPLANAFPSATRLAVTGFPRPEDMEVARAAGFTGVISKPLEIADLDWHLKRAVPAGKR